MPQIVQPDGWQACLLGEGLEPLGEAVGLDGCAVLSGEDEPVLLPGLAPLGSLGVLLLPVTWVVSSSRSSLRRLLVVLGSENFAVPSMLT